MLIAQDVAYTHANGDFLFSHLNLTLNKYAKAALTGVNGSGKSTLLKLLAGTLTPSAGSIQANLKPYYIPQVSGQFNNLTLAQVLGVEKKLSALYEILNGRLTESNLALLDDDWTIEEKCRDAFSHWQLDHLDLTQKMETLSGGQKTKVFLAGIRIHQPEIILMDEPSNHLDTQGRTTLYEYLTSARKTLLVVSHDRALLNLTDTIYELNSHGIKMYPGNYEFYTGQKKMERNAIDRQVKDKEKELRKAKETEKESLERKQKLDIRAKKKQEKSGLPPIVINTLKDKAEKSTSRIKDVHAEKTDTLSKSLHELRQLIPDPGKMKVHFDHASLHTGKILITATNINYGYNNQFIWKQALNFQLISGQRLALCGSNGSGKTTLLKLILNDIQPQTGTMDRATIRAVYIDQEYSFIQPANTVYEQVQQANSGSLQEHDLKIRLSRFLFPKNTWDKFCGVLSSGEKMRLMLCCLTVQNQAPDLIVLDEPTNNLDIQSIEILTAAITEYRGTLIVVSHDIHFLDQIAIEQSILLQ